MVYQAMTATQQKKVSLELVITQIEMLYNTFNNARLIRHRTSRTSGTSWTSRAPRIRWYI